MMHASIHNVAQNSTCERDQLSQGGALLTRLVPQKGAHGMYAALELNLRGEVLAIIPHLRAFGMVLTGDRKRADNLVQETLTTAWGEVHDLEVGTNLRVWLFKVLRQLFYAECTSRISGPDHSADRLSTMTDTGSREAVESFKAILAMFPIEQREALLLMAWEGFSYEEAAEICRCSIDTIQSRLNAARRCCSAPN
jgi:RNA polymerase sigma-70 factor, ECF subfamily